MCRWKLVHKSTDTALLQSAEIEMKWCLLLMKQLAMCARAARHTDLSREVDVLIDDERVDEMNWRNCVCFE